MVLNHRTLFSLLPIKFNLLPIKLASMTLAFSLVSACSHLGSQPDTTNTSINPVVPVVNEVPDTKPNNTEEVETLRYTQEPAPSNAQLAPTDVLGSILDSAKKALKQQQWLRAQRHLEHALRVAPKNAEIYYIYADVYEGLGVQAQMINMLKRAKFLSKPGSEINQLSAEKLTHLGQ